MHDAFQSAYLIPVVAILASVAYVGISAWRKTQEEKIALEREVRLKELELRARASEAKQDGGREPR